MIATEKTPLDKRYPVKQPVRSIAAPLVAALGLFLAACSGGAVGDVGSFEKAIKWGDCKGEDAPRDPFECATIKVPADYRETDGKTLTISLVRFPATEGKAKGIVLTNPGGPGGSGFDYVARNGDDLSVDLNLEQFDIVGFDPRGVDRSGAIRCMTDKELDQFLYLDTTPDTPEEKKLDAESERFDTACGDKHGESLRNFSTENAARDMDLIRASMGFEKMHYLGISYGTYLGGVYATLFPDRVAAMILDSAFDPAGDTIEQRYTTQAVGFDKAFANWVKWCETNESVCAFHSDDVRAGWMALYDRLDKESIVEGKRDVNHEVMDTATKTALYAESAWAFLGQALASAGKGDGTGLLSLADSYNARSEDGTYASQSDSFYVIQCASGMGRQMPEDAEAFVKKLKAAAPWYYRNVEASDFEDPACEKVFGTPELVEVNYSGSAPVVVIGGKNDPATPFRWAQKLTSRMGENARLVEFTGEGHGQVLVSKCIDKIASDLFALNKLPRNGIKCDPDVPMERPAWWKDSVSITGTPLDGAIMNSYFGVEPVDMYAEFFAVQGPVSSAFRSVSASLRSKGLRYSAGDETDPTKAGQFFVDGIDSSKAVGVLISDEKELSDNRMVQPDGVVPVGHVVVAVYYYP